MRTLIFLTAFLVSVQAVAHGLPIEERTDATKRWLAVAMVAEAGWEAEADHRGIFHALKNRFRRLTRRFPKRYPTYLSVVRAYVAAFDPRTKKGGRVRWLMALTQPGRPPGPPKGWPVDRARWDRHTHLWGNVRRLAAQCVDGGRCRDPYKGQAVHWGGAGLDKPQGCMVALPNAGTRNVFYRVDRDCKRRSRASRR